MEHRGSLLPALHSARCVQDFDVLVVGATAPDGSQAVMLGVIPPDEKGWSFPLPVAEARRVAALLIEVADAKERA
jgi:hypothetical protein